MEPGIYFGLDESAYFAAEGLSNSGIKDLTISPLRYWHNHINPHREEPEATPPQRWGKAVHCRLLEPERFPSAYAKGLDKDEHPDALVTMEDLQGFLKANDLPHTGKRKGELVERIRDAGLPVEIWEDLQATHAAQTHGKIVLTAGEWAKLDRLASVVLSDPAVAKTLTDGMPEVSFFVIDPETGVRLKARMDYVKPNSTIDPKTFSNTRGKPIDRAVFDAIYHEAYYQQCVYYSKVRELARQQLAAGEIGIHGAVSEAWLEGFLAAKSHHFGFLFVESTEPHEVRLVQLVARESLHGQLNVYWSAAELTIADRIHQYAEYRAKYGNAPWREPTRLQVLQDTDLPQMMFSN